MNGSQGVSGAIKPKAGIEIKELGGNGGNRHARRCADCGRDAEPYRARCATHLETERVRNLRRYHETKVLKGRTPPQAKWVDGAISAKVPLETSRSWWAEPAAQGSRTVFRISASQELDRISRSRFGRGGAVISREELEQG